MLTTRRLRPLFGIEVLDLEIGPDLSDDKFRQLRRLFELHSVMLPRDQNLSPADQEASTGRFRELEHHVLSGHTLPGHPGITGAAGGSGGARGQGTLRPPPSPAQDRSDLLGQPRDDAQGHTLWRRGLPAAYASLDDRRGRSFLAAGRGPR